MNVRKSRRRDRRGEGSGKKRRTRRGPALATGRPGTGTVSRRTRGLAASQPASWAVLGRATETCTLHGMCRARGQVLPGGSQRRHGVCVGARVLKTDTHGEGRGPSVGFHGRGSVQPWLEPCALGGSVSCTVRETGALQLQGPMQTRERSTTAGSEKYGQSGFRYVSSAPQLCSELWQRRRKDKSE